MDIIKDQIQYNRTVPICYCDMVFEINETITGPVYIYYGLSNFYQNHRRYVKSRDDKQLLGKVSTNINEVATDCGPFRAVNETVPVAPCGAIANSMFNGNYFKNSD